MSTYRVVVTDQVFPSTDLERQLLEATDAELIVAQGDHSEVLAAAGDADALLNTYLPIDADFLSQLKNCKIIARYGIGVDNIDLDTARAYEIPVTNVPDYSVEEVSAHTLTMLLMLLRRVSEAQQTVTAGEWGIHRVRPIERLSELTVGLIGFGRIARKLVESLITLGMTCLVYDPYAPDELKRSETPGVRFTDDLDTLLATSDAVSLHCPLTPETRGLISARELERMPAHAVLVNTSRGPLVKLDDLVATLEAGGIRAAALDVTEPEPPPDPRVLARVTGLAVTPHMAYYSEAALRESQRKATTQVIKALTGQPLDYRVN